MVAEQVKGKERNEVHNPLDPNMKMIELSHNKYHRLQEAVKQGYHSHPWEGYHP